MKTRIISLLLLLSLCSSGRSQPYQPTAENLQSRQEFRDSKFGIFLHWGLYCMLATGEWTMTNKNLNYKEYAKLAGGFYPSRFNAAKWVAAIKASKLKVTAQIQDDQVRVAGAKKDDLQAVIQLLKAGDFGVDLQFINMR